MRGLRKALTRVTREIANYTRAIVRGDITSLDAALGAAERRRATLQAELARLDGNQPAVLQLTPAALERHLQGMVEKLRSGVAGRVREAIQESVARILVGVDGTLTLEAKPDGLLGLGGTIAPLGCRGTGPIMERTIQSATGRHWKVIGS